MQLYNGSGYDLICFGHDHAAQSFSLGRILFFYPGSLGCSHEEYARYGIISVRKGPNGLRDERVSYDREGFLEGFHQKQVPAKDILLRIFSGRNG